MTGFENNTSDKEFVCRACGKFLDASDLVEDGCPICHSEENIFLNDLENEEHTNNKIMSNEPKLTIQKLAPYLPYGLQCHIMGEHNDKNEPKVFKFFGANQDWAEVEGIDKIDNHVHLVDLHYISDCFPILRPLSDLTKEITHNGETFVPIQRLKEIYNSDDDGEPMHIYFDNIQGLRIYGYWDDEQNIELAMPFWMYEKCFEWMIDAYSLIDQNLAIAK